MATEPGRRVRVYRLFIAHGWFRAALVTLAVVASAELSAADVGWVRPNGDAMIYVLTGWLLFVLTVGSLRMRQRMRKGHEVPARAATSPLMPRTTTERWWAAGISLTAGSTEELVYRGFLIAAGVHLYGLHPVVAAVAAGVLFVAAHAYQGRLGMQGAAVIGAMLSILYLISGSLLLPIVVHIVQDLLALLLVPATPTMPGPGRSSSPVPATGAGPAADTGAATSPGQAASPRPAAGLQQMGKGSPDTPEPVLRPMLPN